MTKEQFDEYLWDRSGEPDDLLCKLELLLACYRHARPLAVPGDESGGESGGDQSASAE